MCYILWTKEGDCCFFFSVHLLLQEVPHAEEFSDDSTVWGIRCNKTLAPSPKSPGAFTSAAQLASTPFHRPPGDSVHALEDKGVCRNTSASCLQPASVLAQLVFFLEILNGSLKIIKRKLQIQLLYYSLCEFSFWRIVSLKSVHFRNLIT